jgi:hypothetical protein
VPLVKAKKIAVREYIRADGRCQARESRCVKAREPVRESRAAGERDADATEGSPARVPPLIGRKAPFID